MKQSLSPAVLSQHRQRKTGPCCVIGLAEVCQSEGIAFDSSLQKMLETDFCERNSIERNWLSLSSLDACSYMVMEYHLPLKTLLIWTDKVIQTGEFNHKEQDIHWSQLSALFKVFKSNMDMYLAKEEIILFPSLQSIENGKQTIFGSLDDLQMTAQSLRDDSLQASAQLSEITSLCKNISFQNKRCSAISLLIFLLNRINKLLRMSCYIKDSAIFPRIVGDRNNDGRSVVIAEKGSQVAALNGSLVVAEKGATVNAEKGAFVLSYNGKANRSSRRGERHSRS